MTNWTHSTNRNFDKKGIFCEAATIQTMASRLKQKIISLLLDPFVPRLVDYFPMLSSLLWRHQRSLEVLFWASIMVFYCYYYYLYQTITSVIGYRSQFFRLTGMIAAFSDESEWLSLKICHHVAEAPSCLLLILRNHIVYNRNVYYATGLWKCLPRCSIVKRRIGNCLLLLTSLLSIV